MTEFESAVLRSLRARSANAWDEAEEGAWRDRLRRLGIIARIIGLISQPPSEPVLPPPEPPPAVAPDVRRRRDRGAQRPLGFEEEAALLEHFGHAAAEAASEAEAEAFAGSLMALAGRSLRGRIPARGVLPALVRGLARTTRVLRQSPGMRPLVRTLPTIAQQTMRSISRHQGQGRSVLPASALRILANQVRQVLSDSRRVGQVMQRSRVLDRQYHRAGSRRRG
jgi:hypothetical protein